MKEEQENNKIPDNEAVNLPANRSRKRILGAFFVLVAIASLVLGFSHLTNYLAGRLVKSQVTELTHGVYSVDFKDVKINWSNSQVDLVEFEYKKVNPEQEVDTEIEYRTQLARVKLETILGIYFENALHIEEFVLESPVVMVDQRVEKEKNQNFSFKTGNFYKVVQGIVQSFKIDDFQVHNLSFDYKHSYGDTPQHYYVNDLSFRIQNFQIDSAAAVNDENFFFTESVQLSLKNQVIDLGDGIHQVHLDSLNLSTKNNNIEVYGLQLDTLKNHVNSGNNNASNRYGVLVPYCGIIGIDFLMAYQENVLHVDSIVFNEVLVNSSLGSLKKQEDGKVKIDSTVNNGAIKLLLNVFDRYELEQFEINKTQVELVLENGQDTVLIHDLNFEFSGYQLDSMALTEETYYPVFDGLNLQLSKPEFQLPNGDRLVAKDLAFSTYDSLLIISEVELSGTSLNGPAKSSYQIEAIEFHGIKPREIINTNKIKLTELLVFNPDLKVYSSGNQNNKFKIDFASFLDGKIKSYEIKRIRIVDGKVKFNGAKGAVSKAQVELNRFALNRQSLQKNKFLFSDRTRVNLSNIKAEIPNTQHVVSASNLKLDSRDGLVALSNWNVTPKINDSTSLKFVANAKGKELSVANLDFNTLDNYTHIDLKDLNIHTIDAFVDIITSDSAVKDSNKLSNNPLKKFSEIIVQNVGINNINLNIRKNGASLVKFSNGYLFTDRLDADSMGLSKGELILVSDSISFGLDRVMVPLKSTFHRLDIQSIRQTRNSEFTITGLSYRPSFGVKVPDSLAKLTINIPSLQIDSFDIFGKTQVETLRIGLLSFHEPNIKIVLPVKSKAAKKPFVIPESLPIGFLDSLFQGFDIKGINVVDGRVKLSKNELELAVNKFNLVSSNWAISKSSTWKSSKFLYADDFDLGLSEMQLKLPGIKFNHHVDSINYSFKPNAIGVYGVQFNNTSSNEVKEGSEFTLNLPEVQIINPDVFHYLTDSTLTITRIESFNGMLEADVYGKDTTKKSFQLPVLVPEFKGFSNVALHELEISKMDVQLRSHSNGIITPLEMDHFSLSVDSFHVYPGEPMDSNRLLWADDISLSVQNVFTLVDKGLYELGTDKLTISTQKDSIGLKGLSFIPTVPRLEYPFHKGGFQKDVFNISLKQLEINDLNFSKLVYDGKVKGREIVLEKPHLSVFKDKRNNLPEYSYKAIIPQMFKKIPVKVSFDSVTVNEMNIMYEEFPKTGREPGYLKLTHTNIKVSNLNNDTLDLLTDSTLKITMNSQFLDSGNLNLKLEYNLLSEDNRFTMETTLGAIDGTLINPYIGPTQNAEIISANVDTMHMSVIGNDSMAGGKMGMFYDNLKFSFLNEEGSDVKGVKSWIGNRVVSSKNRFHYFRDKSIFYVRDTSKGWINYLVKIELQGIQANVGIQKHQGKEAKKAEKPIWEAFEKEYRVELKEQIAASKAADKKRKKLARQKKKETRKKAKQDRKAGKKEV